MNAPEEIDGVVEAYRAAVLAKDVDAFVALYEDDVSIFEMWGRWSYEGLDAWRGMIEEWFGSLGDELVSVEMDDVRVITGDCVAVVRALVTYRGLSAGGDELRSMDNRLTWGLRRTEAGPWRIAHEHTSAPVDFETAKVILRR